MRSVMDKTRAVQNIRVLWLLSCETLMWSSQNTKAENQILPGGGDQTASSSQCAQQEAGPHSTDWKRKQVDPTAALSSFIRWGEPGWTQSRSGERKDVGHGLTLGQSLLFSLSSWPLFSGSLQGTGHSGKATDVHLSSQGTERADAFEPFLCNLLQV